MSYSHTEARQFKYMVIRKNGATHNGFPIRNRDSVPKGYQLMGRANTREELKAIIFPN